MYPDLSPDGSKIAYAKRNEGIWIMNRDGSGDHQIVGDTTASYPAWSPDDTLIAYGFYGMHILRTNGKEVIKLL
jgi:Tol biopolymer transport system component